MMTKSFPIRLRGWGREVDYNLYPDSVALELAHENGTDFNSLYGNPMFISPEEGNFNVMDSSLALKIGFNNFAMDSFGVQRPELKLIAKQPIIPQLNILSFQNLKTSTKDWLGGIIKNIETPEEQSAFGLHNMDGVQIIKAPIGSYLGDSGILEGDVITKVEKSKIKDIAGLMTNYQENLWHGRVKLTITRNQKEMQLSIKK